MQPQLDPPSHMAGRPSKHVVELGSSISRKHGFLYSGSGSDRRPSLSHQYLMQPLFTLGISQSEQSPAEEQPWFDRQQTRPAQQCCPTPQSQHVVPHFLAVGPHFFFFLPAPASARPRSGASPPSTRPESVAKTRRRERLSRVRARASKRTASMGRLQRKQDEAWPSQALVP